MAAAGAASACAGTRPHVPAAPRWLAPAELRIRSGGRIAVVSLQEYVLGSIVAEVAPGGESPETVARILQVQAILARSYAVAHLGRHRTEGFDLCDSSHCQLYAPRRLATSRFAAAARTAVQATAGLVLVYAQRPVAAYFHADCGGHTAAADAVWGGPAVPYLRPSRDAVDRTAHREWTTTLALDDLGAMLNADARTRVGGRLAAVDIATRDLSGRAAEVRLAGDTTRLVRGEDLRAAVNARLGDKGLQSTRFRVRRAARSIVFSGTGLGHGVGLCQRGAAARARRGDPVERILEAYFSGARLARG